MDNFDQSIEKLMNDYEGAVKSDAGNGYERLAMEVSALQDALREHIQGLTADTVKKVIDKLKQGQALSADELAEAKLWLVGDAQYYVKMENNFSDWTNELKRLMEEIKGIVGQPADVETASRLRALLRDANGVIDDIFYYVEQRERVAHFTKSTEKLDPESSMMLARILQEKLQSPDS